MVKYRQVTIEWSYPIEIGNILQKSSMKDIGIYYISRQFGNKQSILYIGKTIYSFGRRLSSHKRRWLNAYRGRKFVRLGRIVSPKNLLDEELRAIINDAEKTLIFCVNNIDEHELIANVVSTKSTYTEEFLKIKNIGYRGQLPEEVFIPECMMI